MDDLPSAESIEDQMRGVDHLEARFGMGAVRQMQADDPRGFDIRTFMLGMAIRMASEYQRQAEEVVAEFVDRMRRK